MILILILHSYGIYNKFKSHTVQVAEVYDLGQIKQIYLLQKMLKGQIIFSLVQSYVILLDHLVI